MSNQVPEEGSNAPDKSVLSRVMSENESKQISAVRPFKLISQVLGQLRDREQDVLVARYGLVQGRTTKATLESIGQKLSVTRERVRQIESSALKRIDKKYLSILKPLFKVVDVYMAETGGVADLDNLTKYLGLSGESDVELEQNALRLAMAANESVVPLKKDPRFREGWARAEVDQTELLVVQDKAQAVLVKAGRSMPESDLMSAMGGQLSVGVARGALQSSSKMGQDGAGNWGLASWPTIVPKRVRDKVFAVLESVGKPLHFEEIAKLVQDRFNPAKPVLSRTVHNELIGDKRFVLVGRGIYALTSWGYKPGVVSDVIIEVLKKAGKPMHINEITEAVLARRKVKRNTVVANLQNRNLFQKTDKATYDLARPEASN